MSLGGADGVIQPSQLDAWFFKGYIFVMQVWSCQDCVCVCVRMLHIDFIFVCYVHVVVWWQSIRHLQ